MPETVIPTTLFTPTWTDDTPLDQIPEEHRARVEQERADSARTGDAAQAITSTEVAATAAPAASGSSPKTRARVSTPARPRTVKTGARPRKGAVQADDVSPDPDRVVVIMQTSRFTGRHGRAVPRRTAALVTVERGLDLLMQGAAREATAEESAAALAADPPVFID